MAGQTKQKLEPRVPLSRERVLHAAIKLADEGGVEALSMRKLGQEVGVEAMSLYNHVANKEDVLDGMVDIVMSEINEVVGGIEARPGDWKSVMRRRVLAAREVLLRHPWAPDVMESRANLSAPIMNYFDSVIGLFLDAGFSVDLTHHAMHALGSRALGFTQEMYEDSGDLDENAMAMLQQMATEFPNLVAMVTQITHDADTTLGWCDDQFEFEFALDLILDGLERLRDKETRAAAANQA
jgi:AcrR family transcriptional regulator